MSDAERRLRSELTRILYSESLLRGCTAWRERKCGRPTCHCATGGEKHRSLYLVASEGGKPRQVFVPKRLREDAARWVENYHRARELLEEISKLQYEKLRNREV